MKRKINRVGKNTLTVSLPAKWVRQNNINKDSEIELLENYDQLIIYCNKNPLIQRSIELDINGFSKFMLAQFLNLAYLDGISEIVLNFKDGIIFDEESGKNEDIKKFIQKYINRFVGLEVISQKNNQIILQNLVMKEDVTKIDQIKKRIFFMIEDFLTEFSKRLDTNLKDFVEDAENYHALIVKLICHYLNLLNLSEYTQSQKNRLFMLFNLVDNAMEKIVNVCKTLSQLNVKRLKIKKELQDIFKMFISNFDMVLQENFPLEGIEKLIGTKNDILRKMKTKDLTDMEHRILRECRMLFDINSDFVKCYLVLNIDKYSKKH